MEPEVNKAAFDAEVAKRVELETALAKREQELNTLIEKAAVEDLKKALSTAGLSETLVTPLRTVQKSAEAAFAPLVAELTRLQKAAAATEALTARLGDVGKTSAPDEDSFEGRVEKRAQELLKSGKAANIHKARTLAAQEVSE